MPLPPSKRAALATLFLLAPSPAFAQLVTSVHAVGEASVGWTDNALSQPSSTATGAVGQNGQPAQGGVVSATFLTFRPGALLLVEGRKTLQRLQYTFTSTFYLGRSDANSTGHQLDYNMLYTLSGRSELMAGAGVSYGNQNIFNLMRPAGTPPPQGQPSGNLTFLTASVYESYTHDYSADWRIIQSSAVSSYSVLDVTPPQPHRFTVDQRVGTERRYGKNALIGELYGNYLGTTATENAGLRTSGQSQFLVGVLGRWRRDLSDQFSTEASTGFVTAINPSGETSALGGPTIGAALRFRDDFGEAAIGYNRSFTPNVFLGQIYYGDDVFARGSVPVFERTTNLRFSTGAGLVWSNLVDANVGRLTSTLRVFSADVALTWNPNNGVYASLRYQYYNQKGNPDDERPLFDFERNAVFFTVGGMFPYRYAASVPREPSTRVDRSDRPDAGSEGPASKPLRPRDTLTTPAAPPGTPARPAPGRSGGPPL